MLLPLGRLTAGRRKRHLHAVDASMEEEQVVHLHEPQADAAVELRVELRTQRADRFTYILEILGQILQAARETGNPVRWW